MPRPVIIDTDPGTDDALAIVVALGSVAFEVLGLTTVAGNVSLSDATRNALAILETVGRPDIGVREGADGPEHGELPYAYHFHGETGLTVELTAPTTRPRSGTAVDFIVESARERSGELELIAIGPLTNVAAALDAEPRLPSLLRRIWVMGGAVHSPGNVTPHAEFNFYCDPAAADRVLNSGAAVVMVGLDVCDRVQAGPGDRWFSTGVGRPAAPVSSSSALAAGLLDAWFASHQGERFSMCDPLAMAVALDPSLVELRTGVVAVTTEGAERGRSVAAYGQGSVQVAVEVDVERARTAIESPVRSGR